MSDVVQVLPALSEAIRQVRFDARMTEEEFGKIVGVAEWAKYTVRRWELGLIPPLTEQLLKIGSLAAAGPAKTAIVEELRVRFRDCPLVQVVG